MSAADLSQWHWFWRGCAATCLLQVNAAEVGDVPLGEFLHVASLLVPLYAARAWEVLAHGPEVSSHVILSHNCYMMFIIPCLMGAGGSAGIAHAADVCSAYACTASGCCCCCCFAGSFIGNRCSSGRLLPDCLLLRAQQHATP
jgi:hypothetical protein